MLKSSKLATNLMFPDEGLQSSIIKMSDIDNDNHVKLNIAEDNCSTVDIETKAMHSSTPMETVEATVDAVENMVSHIHSSPSPPLAKENSEIANDIVPLEQKFSSPKEPSGCAMEEDYSKDISTVQSKSDSDSRSSDSLFKIEDNTACINSNSVTNSNDNLEENSPSSRVPETSEVSPIVEESSIAKDLPSLCNSNSLSVTNHSDHLESNLECNSTQQEEEEHQASAAEEVSPHVEDKSSAVETTNANQPEVPCNKTDIQSPNVHSVNDSKPPMESSAADDKEDGELEEGELDDDEEEEDGEAVTSPAAPEKPGPSTPVPTTSDGEEKHGGGAVPKKVSIV